MEMCYDGTLVMPESYAMLDEDSMKDIEGGISLSYHWTMRTKASCLTLASKIISNNNFHNIGKVDLAAEIYTHAFLYYSAPGALLVAASVGYGDHVKSIVDGIDIEDGLDTAKISGVPRYMIYRAMYGAGPAVF